MNKLIWYKEVNDMLQVRNLKMINRMKNALIITKNQIVIELAMQFAREKQL